MAIVIRLGSPADVEVAASVYERSNLARRQGVWPEQASRIKHVAARLREPSSWFLLAEDGSSCVGMAAVEPMRGGDGAGAVVPGVLFLNLVYVVPERWGQGIGGVMLDALIDEAGRRGYSRVHLWTHEQQNERAHRLYRSHGFARTGRTTQDGEGALTGEWVREQREGGFQGHGAPAEPAQSQDARHA